MSSPLILTFEIGGSSTRVGAYKTDGVTPLGSAPTPVTTARNGDVLTPLKAMLQELTENAISRVGSIDAVGVSVTGMLKLQDASHQRDYGPFQNQTLSLSSPNIAGLENVEFMTFLESVGWDKPVHVENDANAVLRSAVKYPDAVGINMGTGVAASVKENGIIRRNPPFWSCFEIGHGMRWTFPEKLTRKCACGLTGCLEAVIGSRALRERYGVRPERAPIEIHEQMREDLLAYGAPAILDTAKRFNQRTILLSGKSILGFAADGQFVDELIARMHGLDPAFEFELIVLDFPDTSGMLGVALAMSDYDIV